MSSSCRWKNQIISVLPSSLYLIIFQSLLTIQAGISLDMSWFDSVITAIQDVRSNDPKNENLSTYMKESLAILAKYDRISNTIHQEIKQEEKQLLDQFEAETKDKSSAELLELDETPYQDGLKKLSLKRQRLSSIYDYQMKIAHNCYDLIDKKIAAFGKRSCNDHDVMRSSYEIPIDEAMKPLAQQLPNILPTAVDDDAMVSSLVVCVPHRILMIKPIQAQTEQEEESYDR
jgi:hypothetical protein